MKTGLTKKSTKTEQELKGQIRNLEAEKEDLEAKLQCEEILTSDLRSIIEGQKNTLKEYADAFNNCKKENQQVNERLEETRRHYHVVFSMLNDDQRKEALNYLLNRAGS